MKRITTLTLFLLLFCSVYAQQLYVGSYNIRYDNPADRPEGNGWSLRCQPICDFINFEEPAIFGTQEVLVNQLHDLQKGLPNDQFMGVARRDGNQAGE